MSTTPQLTVRDQREIDDALDYAIRSTVREMLRHRTPLSLLPGVLRSHLLIGDDWCRCGYRGDWADHVAKALDCAGMVARAF